MRRQRGRRGQGTVVKRPDGRYQAQWSGGRDGNGKRVRKSATFVLQGDADWWLRQTIRAGEAPEDETVDEFLTRWLEVVKVDASTLISYRDHVEHHITPMLGSIRVRSLTTRHVNNLITDRLRHVSPKTKRPLSPTTVRLIVTTLRTALAAGVIAKELPDNVAVGAQMPRAVEHHVEPLTEEDADRIIDAVVDTWIGPIVRFLLGSGLRLGEAVGLNQGDLELEEGYVRLRVSKTTTKARFITDDAVEALRQALAEAPRRGRDEPVFFGQRSRNGHPVDRLKGSSVSHAFPRILTDAGLARAVPHAMRHGLATLMLRQHIPYRTIADQLDHSSTRMTDRYAQSVPEGLRDAVRSAGRPVRRRA